MDDCVVAVLVDAPRHAALTPSLSYRSQRPLEPGTLVRVPFGRREVTGLTWTADAGEGAPEALREIAGICDALPPFSADWCALVEFAAGYYQRSVGEIALAVLPPELRRLDLDAVADRVRRLHRAWSALPSEAAPRHDELPTLTHEQAHAAAEIDAAMARSAPGTTLLHGVTGSGKTEVYLRAADAALAAGRQALVLVPEINLTPQLIERFTRRFEARRIVALHSGLTPAQRLRSWLAAQLGLADLVLGHAARGLRAAAAARLGRRRRRARRFVQAAGRRALLGARPRRLARPARGRARRARLGDAFARDLAARRDGPLRTARASRADRPSVMADRARRRHGARAEGDARAGGERSRAGSRAASRRGAARASRARRAEPRLSQPTRLCTGPAVRRVRLAERLPALQRLARLPQAGPDAALPPLRSRRAGAAPLPRVRQPRHRSGRARHRAARGAARGSASRRAHRPDRRRQHAQEGRPRGDSSARSTRARSTSWSARR